MFMVIIKEKNVVKFYDFLVRLLGVQKRVVKLLRQIEIRGLA